MKGGRNKKKKRSCRELRSPLDYSPEARAPSPSSRALGVAERELHRRERTIREIIKVYKSKKK